MTTAPPIIETRGLTKRFGSRTAVSDLNLTVPAGTAFGFLGHNGAGKTTVIRMLVSLTLRRRHPDRRPVPRQSPRAGAGPGRGHH
jgi:ABC-type branched-subunit amino acid transport system ATPase component